MLTMPSVISRSRFLDLAQSIRPKLDLEERMQWKKPIEGRQVARDHVLHNALSAMCLEYKEG